MSQPEPAPPGPRRGLLVVVLVLGLALLALVLWLTLRETRPDTHPTVAPTPAATTGDATGATGAEATGAASPAVEVSEAALLEVADLALLWPGEWTLVRTQPAEQAEEPPLVCAPAPVPPAAAVALVRSAIHGPLEADGDGFVEVLAGYGTADGALGALAEARAWYADGCARPAAQLSAQVEDVRDVAGGFLARVRLAIPDEPPFWSLVAAAAEGDALVAVSYTQYVGAADGAPPQEDPVLAALARAREKAVGGAG